MIYYFKIQFRLQIYNKSKILMGHECEHKGGQLLRTVQLVNSLAQLLIVVVVITKIWKEYTLTQNILIYYNLLKTLK